MPWLIGLGSLSATVNSSSDYSQLKIISFVEKIEMKSSEIKLIQPTTDATVTAIEVDHVSDIDKKAYTRPVLTRYGKVSRLTAALTGSDTDTLGGNEPL